MPAGGAAPALIWEAHGAHIYMNFIIDNTDILELLFQQYDKWSISIELWLPS